MTSACHFPLSAANRIAVGIDMLSSGLGQWVVTQLRGEGIDPLASLPPSSPVLKQGYSLDLRAVLIVLREHLEVIAAPDDLSALRRLIRDLNQGRDRWAHQQPLSQQDATDWLKAAAELASILERLPTSRSLTAMTTPPGYELTAVSLIINPIIDDARDEPRLPLIQFASFVEEMDRALYGATDQSAFRALTWYTARQHVLGSPLTAALIVQGDDDLIPRDEESLGLPAFWWAYGLSYDAPAEVRREAQLDALSLLEEARADAYPVSDVF